MLKNLFLNFDCHPQSSIQKFRNFPFVFIQHQFWICLALTEEPNSHESYMFQNQIHKYINNINQLTSQVSTYLGKILAFALPEMGQQDLHCLL